MEKKKSLILGIGALILYSIVAYYTFDKQIIGVVLCLCILAVVGIIVALGIRLHEKYSISPRKEE